MLEKSRGGECSRKNEKYYRIEYGREVRVNTTIINGKTT